MEEKIELNKKEEQKIRLWKQCTFNIDQDYQYVKKGWIFNATSNLLYYSVAYPILKVLTKVIYDLKIEGRENIQEIEEGAISISNHVLVLDCAMVGLAFGKRKIYYTTQEESFQIPFVRKLIKLLRAIPIPKKIENKNNFIKEINELLYKNTIVHFYTEATLIPYCENIRTFKNGAFNIALKNNCNIIPTVFIFRDPQGIRKIFKRKKDVTLKILKPIKCEGQYDIPKIEYLKNKIKNEMEKAQKNEMSEDDEMEIYVNC